ncbi:MAG: hypothetical protein GW823_06330 [Bacteroidetes bacterium]|nr:hypothetical protein [Bacteroidota bacterium]
MIILDKPYVSNYLVKTILSEKLLVLRNSFTESLPELATQLISDSAFVERIKTGSTMRFIQLQKMRLVGLQSIWLF